MFRSNEDLTVLTFRRRVIDRIGNPDFRGIGTPPARPVLQQGGRDEFTLSGRIEPNRTR
jgi:hypothetical protein